MAEYKPNLRAYGHKVIILTWHVWTHMCCAWCQGLAYFAAVEIKHCCCFPYPHMLRMPNQEHTSRAWNPQINENITTMWRKFNKKETLMELSLSLALDEGIFMTYLSRKPSERCWFWDVLLTGCCSNHSLQSMSCQAFEGSLASHLHKMCKCLQKCLMFPIWWMHFATLICPVELQDHLRVGTQQAFH